MVFEQGRNAIYRYVFKRFEIALGLGLILFVAISEDMISITVACIIFGIVFALSIPSVIKGVREMQGTKLIIENGIITVSTQMQQSQYNLHDFKIILYKKNLNKITSFAMMSETQGIKIEYYQQMNEIYDLLHHYVDMTKKLPWWQRL